MESIFADAVSVKYPKESLIVSDGVHSEDMYRVVSGRVRVEKGDSKTNAVGQGAVVRVFTLRRRRGRGGLDLAFEGSRDVSQGLDHVQHGRGARFESRI